MIDGVIVTPLKRIDDSRGAVMHMLRSDAAHFAGFGEIYFSMVNPGVTKGWKRHTRMVLSLAVPVGRLCLGLIDTRPGSPTEGCSMAVVLDRENYALVTVPPGIWSAFRGLSDEPALLANCASILHDPTEAENCPADSPPLAFQWPAG